METLESLNGFQSAVDLLVEALDEVRGFRTSIVKQVFRFHIACEQIAVVENMLERCDLHRVIVVPWRSPADVAFEVRLSQVREIEDLLFQIFDECSVGFLATHFQSPPDILEEVHMAELHDDTGVDCSRRHADGFVVIADQGKQFVAGVLELREELQQRLVVL